MAERAGQILSHLERLGIVFIDGLLPFDATRREQLLELPNFVPRMLALLERAFAELARLIRERLAGRVPAVVEFPAVDEEA